MTYSQYSHHDTTRCLLSDKQQAELIERWQQHSDKLQSFDDVIIEAQQAQGARYERTK